MTWSSDPCPASLPETEAAAGGRAEVETWSSTSILLDAVDIREKRAVGAAFSGQYRTPAVPVKSMRKGEQILLACRDCLPAVKTHWKPTRLGQPLPWPLLMREICRRSAFPGKSRLKTSTVERRLSPCRRSHASGLNPGSDPSPGRLESSTCPSGLKSVG